MNSQILIKCRSTIPWKIFPHTAVGMPDPDTSSQYGAGVALTVRAEQQNF